MIVVRSVLGSSLVEVTESRSVSSLISVLVDTKGIDWCPAVAAVVEVTAV